MEGRAHVEAEVRSAGSRGAAVRALAAAPARGRDEQRAQAADEVRDDGDVDEVRDAREAAEDGGEERLRVAGGLGRGGGGGQGLGLGCERGR